MEIIIRRRDIYVVVVALFLFVSWVAYARYEDHATNASLKNLASGHVDEWFNSEAPDVKREDFEYVAIVDTERPYELFGPTYGVVHVYIREKGDIRCETFKGIEYYYRHDGEKWELGDSAGCGAKEHHIRAFEDYLTQGYGVEERVFDDALGIDFDVERLRARLEGGAQQTAGSHNRDHEHDHGHEDGHAHEQGHQHEISLQPQAPEQSPANGDLNAPASPVADGADEEDDDLRPSRRNRIRHRELSESMDQNAERKSL